MTMIPFLVLLIVFCSFWTLEIIAIRRWRGVWRLGAALPGVALAAIALNILIGTLRDPTSHNLWPLEIALWSAGGLVFLGLLAIARKIFGAS